jgi:hypothetical protein
MELSEEECRVLVDLLKDRFGSLKEEIYHTETSSYRDQLHQQRDLLESLIRKLESLIPA